MHTDRMGALDMRIPRWLRHKCYRVSCHRIDVSYPCVSRCRITRFNRPDIPVPTQMASQRSSFARVTHTANAFLQELWSGGMS